MREHLNKEQCDAKRTKQYVMCREQSSVAARDRPVGPPVCFSRSAQHALYFLQLVLTVRLFPQRSFRSDVHCPERRKGEEEMAVFVNARLSYKMPHTRLNGKLLGVGGDPLHVLLRPAHEFASYAVEIDGRPSESEGESVDRKQRLGGTAKRGARDRSATLRVESRHYASGLVIRSKREKRSAKRSAARPGPRAAQQEPETWHTSAHCLSTRLDTRRRWPEQY